MKKAYDRFDDPEELGRPSGIFIDIVMRLEILDYARRYYERKGDSSSMKRAKEIRRLYKKIILDSVMVVRSLIPDEVMNDFHNARKDYLKENK
jgi:hypothetical protein